MALIQINNNHKIDAAIIKSLFRPKYSVFADHRDEIFRTKLFLLVTPSFFVVHILANEKN